MTVTVTHSFTWETPLGQPATREQGVCGGSGGGGIEGGEEGMKGEGERGEVWEGKERWERGGDEEHSHQYEPDHTSTDQGTASKLSVCGEGGKGGECTVCATILSAIIFMPPLVVYSLHPLQHCSMP